MSGATLRQCAILAGGLGTRLGTLTTATPKPLLPCGDRPFLAWVMREWLRFGVTDFLLLGGHLAEVLREALPGLRATLPEAARIELVTEPPQAGTGGALHHARAGLDQQFLLVNGDSLLDTNLSRLLADVAADGAQADGRLVLRAVPDASRYGVVTLDGACLTAFAERPAPGTPGIINTGIYALHRRVAEMASPACSLERDLLPALAAAGRLRGTVAEGYFIDIGVPADFARAAETVPGRLHRPALFLDRDGVINLDHGWVGSRERFVWNTEARDAIAEATDAGWHVFVVTNQSGIARGLYDEAQLAALHEWMVGEIRRAGGTIDALRYCPHHPHGSVARYAQHCSWRKPGAGMITDLIAAWALDPKRCVLIGDQPSDLQAAEAAGIASHRYQGGSLRAMVRAIIASPPPKTSATASAQPRPHQQSGNTAAARSSVAARPHHPAR